VVVGCATLSVHSVDVKVSRVLVELTRMISVYVPRSKGVVAVTVVTYVVEYVAVLVGTMTCSVVVWQA
jgi:hypothetical protein